jgi:hypothetical protein
MNAASGELRGTRECRDVAADYGEAQGRFGLSETSHRQCRIAVTGCAVSIPA